MDQFISQLALTLIGGAVGAAITLWVGWSQFRKQRWWDKKLEAYSAIFAAFHALLDEDAAYEDAAIENRKVSDSEKDELRRKAKLGEAELWRQMRLSSLLISDQAEQALRKMFRDLESAEMETDWVHFRNLRSQALWDGFGRLKVAAKDSLRVNSARFLDSVSG
jgi:hypothetical protein